MKRNLNSAEDEILIQKGKNKKKNLSREVLADLYQKFLDGDNSAFDEIVTNTWEDVRDFVLSNVIPNMSIAEDVTQVAFLYLLEHPDYFNPKFCSLLTYIKNIAKCRALNEITHMKCKTLEPLETLDISTKAQEVPDFAGHIDDKLKLDKAISVLKQLKFNYQEVITLADFEGYSNPEIAKMIGKSTLQTKTLLYNARKKYKSLLEKEGISYND